MTREMMTREMDDNIVVRVSGGTDKPFLSPHSSEYDYLSEVMFSPISSMSSSSEVVRFCWTLVADCNHRREDF